MDQLRLNIVYLLMRLRKWILILSGFVLVVALLMLSLWLTREQWLPSVVNYGLKDKGWQVTDLSWSKPYQIDRLSLSQTGGPQLNLTAIKWQNPEGLLQVDQVRYQMPPALTTMSIPATAQVSAVAITATSATTTNTSGTKPAASNTVAPADLAVTVAQYSGQINRGLERAEQQLAALNQWAAYIGFQQLKLPNIQVALADRSSVQLDGQISRQDKDWQFNFNAQADSAPDYALTLNGQLNSALARGQLWLKTPAKGVSLSNSCQLKAGERLQLDFQLPLQAFSVWQFGVSGLNLRHSANCVATLMPLNQPNWQAPKAGGLQVGPMALRLDLARNQLKLPQLNLVWKREGAGVLPPAAEAALRVQPEKVAIKLTALQLGLAEQTGQIDAQISLNTQGTLLAVPAEGNRLLTFSSRGAWRNSPESLSYQSVETQLQIPALNVQAFQFGRAQLSSPVSLLWQKANGLLQLAASVLTEVSVQHTQLKKPLALVFKTELSGSAQQPLIQLQSLTPDLPLLLVLNSEASALGSRAVSNTAQRLYVFSTAPILLSHWAQKLKLPDDLLLSDGQLQFNGALNLNAANLSASTGQFELRLEQGAGRYLGYQWSGLSVPLRLNYQGQEQPISIQAQQLFLQRLWAGVELQNLRLNLNAQRRVGEPAFTGQVSELRGDLWGGRFNLDQLSYPIPEAGNDSLINLRQLDLQKLVNASNEQKIKVTGSVSGQLPVRLYADGVEIKQGLITSDTNGKVSLKNNPAWQVMLQQQPILANSLRHLNDLDYTRMEGHLEMARSGNLKAALKILGENKAEGQPVNFNFNSEQNILTLLKALRLTQQLNDSLDNRMKRKDK